MDVSPLRRVNQAIWLLCTGAREAAFRNIKTIAECLADELINAAKVNVLIFVMLKYSYYEYFFVIEVLSNAVKMYLPNFYSFAKDKIKEYRFQLSSSSSIHGSSILQFNLHISI